MHGTLDSTTPDDRPQSAPAAVPATPVTDSRPTINNSSYDQSRNVFRKSQQLRPALPTSPPETPVTASNQAQKKAEILASSDKRRIHVGNYEIPLHDPEQTSYREFVAKCLDEHILEHNDARKFKALADKHRQMKNANAVEMFGLREKLAEAKSLDESLLQQVSERAELVKRLELAENALAVEKSAKKNLESQLTHERQAKSKLQSEFATMRQVNANLQAKLDSGQRSKKTLEGSFATVL